MSKLIDFPLSKKAFRIEAKSDKKAEVYIYGAIGASIWEDSISAKQFSEELKKLSPNVKEIDLRLNSPGGDVFEGYAIYNQLKQHPAKKTVYIDGLAASIASVIALAGDEIIMGEGAQFMVHKSWTMAFGNSFELERVIERLESIDEQLISLYTKKTKKPRAEIRDMVEKETWLNAEEAVEIGFADRVMESDVRIAASVLDRATWITKAPKNLSTRDKVVRAKIEEFIRKNK